MAQGKKMPESGTIAGAPSAFEAGRLVVLAKPMPSGAGYYCQPFAVVRFEDLPEELRRQNAAALPRDPNAAAALVAAPLRGEGDARLPVDVVPGGLRRQLPGLVSGAPNDEPTVKFAGDGTSDYSERCILRVQAHPAVGTEQRAVPDPSFVCLFFRSSPRRTARWWCTPGSRSMGSATWWEAFSTRRMAFVETQALLGNGCTTEQGVYYYDDVLVPPAGEALRAPRSRTYAVQVSVDAAAGSKGGDPTAAGVTAAGADAGHDHGGNLSAVLGIVVASSAATALAAGSLGAATAFGLFAALVGGLSLTMASVHAM